MRPSDQYTSQSTLVPVLCAFALGLFGLNLYTYISKFFNTCPPPEPAKTETVEGYEVLLFEGDVPENIHVYKLDDGQIKVEIKHEEGADLEQAIDAEYRKRPMRPPHRFRHPHHRKAHWNHRFPRHGRKNFIFRRDLDSCLAVSYPNRTFDSLLLEHDMPVSSIHNCQDVLKRHAYRSFESRFDRERAFYLDSDIHHRLRSADMDSWNAERSLMQRRRVLSEQSNDQTVRLHIKRFTPNTND